MKNINIDGLRYRIYPDTFRKAEKIVKSNAIDIISVEGLDDNLIMICAEVQGSYDQPYDTRIIYDGDTGYMERSGCNCEAFQKYYGPCKHCIALALHIHQKQIAHELDVSNLKYKTNSQLMHLMKQQTLKNAQTYFEGGVDGIIELEPFFHISELKEWSVEFKIGTKDKKYVLKDLGLLDRLVSNLEHYSYGKKLAFIHSRTAFTKTGLLLYDFIHAYLCENEGFNKLYNSRYYNDSPTIRKIPLSSNSLIQLLEILKDEKIHVNDDLADIKDSLPVLYSKVDQAGLNWILTLPKLVCIRNFDRAYLYHNKVFYRFPDDYPRDALDLFELTHTGKYEYTISEEDLPAFCSSFLSALEATTICEKASSLDSFRPVPCIIQFYFDHVADEAIDIICCEPYAVYGDLKCNLFSLLENKDILNRDVIKEGQALHTLHQYFPECGNDFAFIAWEDEESIYKLISTGLDQLRQLGEVYLSSSMRSLIITRPPKVNVNVSLNVGLLDMKLTTNLPPDELEQLLNSYHQHKKYYRLKNGNFIQLEDSSLSALAELSEGLELDTKQLADGHLQLPKYHSLYINQVLKDNEAEIETVRNYDFRQIIRNMQNIENSDYESPKDLKTELRPYQKFGYQWLRTLADLGFGGILADDMGLGKTVQIIAFLLAKVCEAEAENKIIKALIVCPASLVYNWESEIQRFAPFLSVCTIVGTTEQRKELIGKQGQYDITLTSYDLLKRDLESYKNYQYDYEIIDEAQNIKNYTTQAAKAVKSIQADIRFALTGTPIENSLSELWSIFDYLMPSLLGSYQKFRKKYENPIIANTDNEISKRLQKMVKPFILRRLKRDVLKELPDKIEKVILSKMENEQECLYNANAQKVLASLAAKSDDEFKTSRIQILAELTKLRQLCCDPSLIYDDYQGGSAKLEACMELVNSAIDANNKILIFSQFTSMLDIIKGRLDELKIDAYMLTGSTTKEKRRELVDRFNKDQTPVFLISLKAGGTGLNLTAASIVIHYDPWWNLAAQNQATDRTHRIGQEQVVTVYKLLAKDTIEEKIEKLQEKKAQLSDQIISEGGITQDIMSKSDFMDFLSVVEK